MKGIAIILVLLNVVAFLLGLKVDPENAQAASTSAHDSINAAGISVIIPQSTETVSAENVVSEDGLAQLKVNSSGKVLIAQNETQTSSLPVLPVKVIPPEAQRKVSDQAQSLKQAETQVEVAQEVAQAEGASPQSIVSAPDTAGSVQKSIEIARASIPAETPAPSVEDSLACYRIGPFTGKDNLANTRKALVDNGVAFKLDEEKVQASAQATSQATKVYLSGFSDRAALDKQRKQLKQMKIDHFPTNINGESVIQLGSFSDSAHALSYQKQLKNKGFQAKTTHVQAAQSTKSWLDLARVSQSAIKQLNLPGHIKTKSRPCQ